MTELRFGTLEIPGVRTGGDSPLPAMRNALTMNLDYQIDESDGLFIGYGLRLNSLPHRMQNRYGTKMETLSFRSAVLENDFLRAEFLPEIGGRLWSLFDKKAQRDLVTANPVYLPGNFALCNAWVAGGVEWNIGQRGHHALTCRPMFTAETQDEDGTPVLRMYEFCRERAIAYQMEFFLPENSRFLFVRVRILNHHDHVTPMYWWSNIAVDERPDLRVVTPADTTFCNTYISNTEHILRKLPMPTPEGFDCTYPTNYPTAKDHFFNIDFRARKYEAALYGDGYGLVQCSTDRLQGRKLFVWGQSQGGRRWQRKLTCEGAPGYAEIQAGLAHTQLECLPMPPRTAWEWCEAYGALQADPKKVHGAWSAVQNEVSSQLEAALPRRELDGMLERTRKSFALKPARMVFRGSGWGKLENDRLGKSPWPQLDFESDDSAPEPWRVLLTTGRMAGEKIPADFMIQDEYFRKLLAVEKPNAVERFELGLNYYSRDDFERAERCWEDQEQWLSLYARSNLLRVRGDLCGAAKLICRALELFPDESLAKEAFATCTESGMDALLLEAYGRLPESIRRIPMCEVLYAGALARSGRWREAEAIVMRDGGIDVPDLREGEKSLADIYRTIRVAEAKEQNREIDPETVEIPFSIDFRMNVPDKERM